VASLHTFFGFFTMTSTEVAEMAKMNAVLSFSRRPNLKFGCMLCHLDLNLKVKLYQMEISGLDLSL
jgi:hypothetical protein